MSTPIIEQIAVKLAALINGITVANGFNQTLTAVRPRRIHLEGDLNTDNAVIIEQADGAASLDANETTIWQQAFAIQALVIDSDDATAALDTRLNQVAADIIKKLFTGDNSNFDGLADGIFLQGTERFIADPQLAGIAVNIIVQMPFDTADPYTQS
jgi:hypothetical protein